MLGNLLSFICLSNNINYKSLSIMKLIKGQELYLIPSYLDSRKSEPEKVIIKTVGRKYFQLEEYSRNKYSLETLSEVNDINYKGQCYITLQEILDLKEHINLFDKVKNIFVGYNKIDISLSQLREINNILNTLFIFLVNMIFIIKK